MNSSFIALATADDPTSSTPKLATDMPQSSSVISASASPSDDQADKANISTTDTEYAEHSLATEAGVAACDPHVDISSSTHCCHSNNAGFVYIFRDLPRRYLIGSSWDVKHRFSQLKIGNLDLKRVAEYHVQANCVAAEKQCHDRLMAASNVKHLAGGWFLGEPDDITTVVERVCAVSAAM